MSRRNGGSHRWRQTVAYVIRRDGGICWICGQPDADSADHVIPVAQGGTDDPDNLRAAHHVNPPHCNRLRGDRSVEYARQTLARTAPPATEWVW